MPVGEGKECRPVRAVGVSATKLAEVWFKGAHRPGMNIPRLQCCLADRPSHRLTRPMHMPGPQSDWSLAIGRPQARLARAQPLAVGMPLSAVL